MNNRPFWPWIERFGWSLLILLLAAALRFHDLAAVPPGMTHDEADHGLTAWRIASDGLREIYFTIGYGREPLYDYTVAGFMSFLGPTIYAARLVSVFAGILLIAGMIAWVKLALGREIAWMTGAGLAVGFWPLMSSRQALRSILLPMIFVLAVLLFWLALKNLVGPGRNSFFWRGAARLLPFIAAGVLLGLTFYTYIPARALWIVFPAMLFYWLAKKRDLVPQMWWRIAIMLLVMFLIAAPLLLYLQSNPTAELRIRQLAQPLYLAQQGDWLTLGEEAYDSLRLFFIEGDPAWRYNIYKRPFLTPLFGVLFVLGLLQTLRWMIVSKESGENLRGSASFLALSWLIVGFAPVLITGPALSMTQAIAVQPLIYLFPAITLAGVIAWITGRFERVPRKLSVSAVVLLYAALALVTWRAFFQTWANHPQVRVQYETTMATAVDYVNRNREGEVAISTITPGRYHSPALAEMILDNEEVTLRWFDGRGSLLLPRQESAAMVVPGFTPLSPVLAPYLQKAELVETLPLRASDLDRPLQLYDLNRTELLDAWQERLTPLEATFGDTITLAGFELLSEKAAPGEEISVVTFWRAQQPLSEAVIFTHLLGADGVPLAQADRLDVPGYSWQPGDTFLQAHSFTLPEELEPGTYTLAAGVYSLPDGQRLLLSGEFAGADMAPLTTVTIVP